MCVVEGLKIMGPYIRASDSSERLLRTEKEREGVSVSYQASLE